MADILTAIGLLISGGCGLLFGFFALHVWLRPEWLACLRRQWKRQRGHALWVDRNNRWRTHNV